LPPVLWQKHRSGSSKLNARFTGANAGTLSIVARSRLETIRQRISDVTETTRDERKKIPPATQSAPPDKELERKLQKDPDDDNAKVDVGSDESMDASDPPSSSQPGKKDEPVPSSGFPDN
jgi:hypothetical protein